MKIEKNELEFDKAITKEWLLTNGIGGYSSSTILGINTRKYHGLLIASLNPPSKRYLILSKIDESIYTEGKKYEMSANICKNYISEGYKYQEKFEKEYIPIFTYKIGNITIKKIICMEYLKNTICILYNIENQGADAKLFLTPILNFRDFHEMRTNHKFTIKQSKTESKVKIEIDRNFNYPIYIKTSEGNYIEHFEDQFNNMYYREEEKRGFYPEENHSVPRKIRNRYTL